MHILKETQENMYTLHNNEGMTAILSKDQTHFKQELKNEQTIKVTNKEKEKCQVLAFKRIQLQPWLGCLYILTKAYKIMEL